MENSGVAGDGLADALTIPDVGLNDGYRQIVRELFEFATITRHARYLHLLVG
jgi:hypothetical protein